MEKRLASLQERYQTLEKKLCDPDVLRDQQLLKAYAKERAELEPICQIYTEQLNLQQQMQEAEVWLRETDDHTTRTWLEGELRTLEGKLQEVQKRLRTLLLPKDPHADKNIILEIRGAAGGEEAALFASTLYRMYMRYAEEKGWKAELLEKNFTELGGFKDVLVSIQGRGAYQHLKHESGAHRVQRVPTTESGGRIHTSTATVMVLPEAEEIEVVIDEKDLRIDTFCSSGPGGQSVNTTKSAVRVTHIPTGLVVSCQDGKSQNMNKAQALRVLRARLLDRKHQEEEVRRSHERRSIVGTGDRSERIRTYNYPQGRVTDHRIHLTSHRLDAVLDGNLDEFIQALLLFEQEKLLLFQEKGDANGGGRES
ncbi:peptide chain release factor 1 [Pasteuria penetrans]|uniref:peptide chain release factor 1 n=1 Tax=Pasteuria penetrans TaxID=86005 RepID=UPI000FA97018|nr:peptide chain release factor 1 [Pasteuria penetrans]